jgi:hypothetical protein
MGRRGTTTKERMEDAQMGLKKLVEKHHLKKKIVEDAMKAKE